MKTQSELAKEYEEQQTKAGKAALDLEKKLACMIYGKKSEKEISVMYNEKTGEKMYFQR